MDPDSSLCHNMLDDNTEHHSVSMSSSDSAIVAIAYQHNMELKCFESSMDQLHFFSSWYKTPMCDKVDNNENMNVMFGSFRSATSIPIEQGYGTHSDLYKNLPSEVWKQVHTLQKRISAMPKRKLRNA